MDSKSKKRLSRTGSFLLFYALLSTVLCFICFAWGYRSANVNAKKEIDLVHQKYNSAYFITVDEQGAWLGDVPGQKFFPLYDANGNRLGAKQ